MEVEKSIRYCPSPLSSPTSMNRNVEACTLGGYEILREIGRGSTGVIKLARKIETQENVCCKVIEKNHIKTENDLKFLRTEVEVFSSVDHPNICHFIGLIEDEKNYYIFMEYVKGITLTDLIEQKKGLNEGEAAKIFSQVLSALSYLHERCIAHRDVKPDNIMISTKTSGNSPSSKKGTNTQYVVKLIDFGLCTNGGETLRETFCGSPLFAAPECLKNEPYVAMKSDIWSAGVVFYVMITGTFPWNVSNLMQMINQIVEGDFIIPHNVSKASADLIRSMLNLDPNSRPTANEILNSPDLRLLIPVCCPRPKYSYNASLAKLVRKPSFTHERRHSNPVFNLLDDSASNSPVASNPAKKCNSINFVGNGNNGSMSARAPGPNNEGDNNIEIAKKCPIEPIAVKTRSLQSPRRKMMRSTSLHNYNLNPKKELTTSNLTDNN